MSLLERPAAQDLVIPAAICLAVIASLTAAIIRFAIYSTSASIFGRSVHCGPGNRQSIALTFDDGPSASTMALATYLVQEGVRATFFQCGANVVRNPGISRQLSEMGHELGNHTYTHIRLAPRLGWRLNLVGSDKIYKELLETQIVIEKETGVPPTWFRAPYGMRWFGLAGALRRLGLTGVMWTVIAHDWEWSTDDVLSYVLQRTKPGGILCFHDGRDIRPASDISLTLNAIHQLVPRLKSMGYGFETISEIMRP